MKIHSIKFKITLLLVVTVTCLVAMLIGFNSIFSEKVYMNRKQKSMINSLRMLMKSCRNILIYR